MYWEPSSSQPAACWDHFAASYADICYAPAQSSKIVRFDLYLMRYLHQGVTPTRRTNGAAISS